MSWTPYTGDPYAQPGESDASRFGQNVNPLTRTSRTTNMSPRHRLTTSLAGAVPYSQLTPDAVYFRDSIATGRWGADSFIGAHAPVCHMRRHDDGTTDLVKLEAHGKFYIDLGGKGGRDVGVGKA